MRIYILTRTLNVGINHIISFLEKHPELGEVTNLTSNSQLNDKQVAAVVDFFKDELNNVINSTKTNSESRGEKTNQENGVLKNHITEFKPEIKVVGKIDLETLNQSTRPKKKTKEERRKEREEREKLRQEQRQLMKEAIIEEIHNTVYGSDKRNLTTYNSMRLNELSKKINISMKHIISYLKKHPELGEAPMLDPNSRLNVEQVSASIDYFNDNSNKPNRPIIFKNNSNNNEDLKTEKQININPSNLQFKQGYAKILFKKDSFVLKEGMFNKELNKIKTNRNIFNNETIKIIINNETKSFYFTDSELCERLKLLGKELHAKKLENRKEKEQSKINKAIIVNANLTKLEFYDGFVCYTYNNIQYTHHDYSILKKYNTLLKIAKTNGDCKNSLKKNIQLTLNILDRTFIFNYNFNINNYLRICWKKYVKNDLYEIPSLDCSHGTEIEYKTSCKIENIEFFDGYYKIWIVKNGVKMNNIYPLTIKDINSLSCLQIVSKYFENRIPNDVVIVFTNKKVEGLINGFKLQKYVEILKKNKEIPSDWWNKSDNREFKTLENYRKIPSSFVNKEASYKTVYIDYLTRYQNENPLLIAYEIFNGQEEKCFVFNISIDDKRSAIIYENININRATNIFIIDKQDYEESMNLIFNYFTDEELSRKRMSIRTNQNPPEKFKAIEIRTINHDNLNLWINNLNDLITPSSKPNADDKNPKHIQFVSGLNLRSGNTERVNIKGTTIVKNIHDEMKEKLYLQLSKKYGADNVGTEISIGQKKIDLVVKHLESYDLYEVKTNQDVRICIREAIGQIIDYAFFECKDRIGKMFIIGPNQISKEAVEYLKNIRFKHNLPIYYQSID